jgi:hypothetical protein
LVSQLLPPMTMTPLLIHPLLLLQMRRLMLIHPLLLLQMRRLMLIHPLLLLQMRRLMLIHPYRSSGILDDVLRAPYLVLVLWM